MKWTLTVVGVFLVGMMLGVTGAIPAGLIPDEVSTWLLYLLILQVGIGIGSGPDLKKLIKSLNLTALTVPLCTVVGSLAGAAVLALVFSDLSLSNCLALGSGFGYYSISPALITEMRTPQIGASAAAHLGALALLINIFRELAALGAAPILRRYFGIYAPVCAAGVTSCDVLLPSIIRYSGPEIAPLAVIHGILLEPLIPLLIATFCLFQ